VISFGISIIVTIFSRLIFSLIRVAVMVSSGVWIRSYPFDGYNKTTNAATINPVSVPFDFNSRLCFDR
jgi:hypothetical protein